MPEIKDSDGKVIQRSKNLAGIRQYVRHYLRPIKTLDVSRIADDEGKLSILFENGCSYETNFGSFEVLCGFVSRWRNVHGAPLTINGNSVGKVSSVNPPNMVGPTVNIIFDTEDDRAVAFNLIYSDVRCFPTKSKFGLDVSGTAESVYDALVVLNERGLRYKIAK